MTWLLLLSPVPALVCLAITVALWRRHVRRAWLADRGWPVPATVILASEPPLEVEIDLRVPYSTTGLSVDEVDRRVRVQPFVVRTDLGQLVDVEPVPGVELRAPLQRAVKRDDRHFTKVARVIEGDRVYLAGTTTREATHGGGPFRDDNAPHAQLAATVVSTEPLGDAARRSAATARAWLARWAVMAVLGPVPYAIPLVPAFVLAFWIRSLVAKQSWWERARYREHYGSGTTRADRAEYH